LQAKPGHQRKVHALQRQIARLEQRLHSLHLLSRRYTTGRVAVVLGGLCATLIAERLLNTGVGLIIAGLCTSGFLSLAAFHKRVKTRIAHYTIWRRLKAGHVARLQRDWERIPRSPQGPEEPEHLFAADLNITGERSLLQLLDTTMSQGGSARLRTWLLQPILDATQIHARQERVRELVPLAAFRDHLALCGTLVARTPGARWEGEHVLAWLQRHTAPPSLARWVVLLGLLAAINIVLMSLHALAVLPAWWPLSLFLYLVLYQYKHGEAHDLFVDAHHLEQVLEHLRGVLLYLETRKYSGTPHLATLCAPFWRPAQRPSVALKRIARIAGAAGVQHSHLMGFLINALVPWDLYFVHRLNRYKEAIKNDLPAWIDTWYELEALNALAHFGYLHPDFVFPDVLPVTTPAAQPILRARGLGHPLLPTEVRVCNDFTFTHLGEIALITGSNMSGKSTFLRTLGVNLCLAYAGAPVNATALQTVLLRLFTCIKISDSVTDGISYFYAEVRRLKALLSALTAAEPIGATASAQGRQALPLCFLIDEIFRGTNNRERLIGSQAYIHALTRGHGVGVISTHDLELVTLADSVPRIHNYHFREEVHDGRMIFDYQLRLGPCPTTNALKIMQMEGLPVNADRGCAL
jgi:hypothetical protein